MKAASCVVLLGIGGLLASIPGHAGSLSSTVTLTSDYLFDGVSQTQNAPAMQASLDWSGARGFYLGTWISNVDFGPGDPAQAEIDLYGGYSRTYENGWGWSAGFARYTYKGAPAAYNYTELTAAVTLPTTTTVQVWRSSDDVVGGVAYRFKVKHSVPLPKEFSLDLEATRTVYANPGFDDFTHGQVGVSRTFGRVKAYLGYADTSLDPRSRVAANGDSLVSGRWLLTLSTTIDWIK
jgi:uncharacterized protein (TIGR02001 family)